MSSGTVEQIWMMIELPKKLNEGIVQNMDAAELQVSVKVLRQIGEKLRQTLI